MVLSPVQVGAGLGANPPPAIERQFELERNRISS
jgi:hypothetical protein